jgi:hypothetical protein
MNLTLILLISAAVWLFSRPRVKVANPQDEGFIDVPHYWPELPEEVNDGWSQPTDQASTAPEGDLDEAWVRETYERGQGLPPGIIPEYPQYEPEP